MELLPEDHLEVLCNRLAYLDENLDGNVLVNVNNVDYYKQELAIRIINLIAKEDYEFFLWTDGYKTIFLSSCED